MRTAFLAGGTGLIGSQLLDLLLNNNLYDRVVAISRSPLSRVHPKLTNPMISYDKLEGAIDLAPVDDVFCCLGTTIRKAGSRKEFMKVDLDYPVKIGEWAKSAGASRYFLVSSMGANRNSLFFYNRVKGVVEESISKLNLESTHIFRPSLLLGPRKEKRWGEDLGKMFMKPLAFLFPKDLRAIESIKVARAMIEMAGGKSSGKQIHRSGEMQSF